MDKIITFIRTPIAILAIIIIAVNGLLAFIIEIPILIIWFTLLSIFSNKSKMQQSWVTSFPNSLSQITTIISNVLIWAKDTTSTPSYQSLSYKNKQNEEAHVAFNILALILILGTIITILDLWGVIIIIGVIIIGLVVLNN